MPDAVKNDGEQFRLPDLGEGLTEADIVAWHVRAGDHVVADQPLVSVETDKAVVEIPAPHGGRIATLGPAVGESLEVGDVLVTYAGQDENQAEAPPAIAGELPESKTTPPRKAPTSIKASPRARRRARELDIALAEVKPTGVGGVIELVDVEAAATTGVSNRLTGVRRAMARRMATAHARVARASVTGEANINTWPSDTRLLPRLIRAVTAACGAQPLLNARFDDEAFALTRQSEVNLGIAMETVEGLFVPVMRQAENLDLAEIAAQLGDLESKVAARTIDRQLLGGQTITVSNFGAVGGLHAEMVVVPPQVAIVGAGRSFERLVIDNDEPANNRFLPLSITFDHRVITGVEACQFLLALIEDLESIY